MNNPKFNVIFSSEINDFLNSLEQKAKEKILFNISKSKFYTDNELFKKLENTEIWEFRTLYKKTSYRLLAFWDKRNNKNTLVICTHGFIKKTNKTPKSEIEKANQIKKIYFETTK